MGRIEDTAKTPTTRKGADPFGLAVYGDSLLSRNVRLWIIAFTVAMIAQFCVDIWAWFHAWKYGTENWLFAVIGGAVFATAILLFDRSVIIHDTQHNRWSWLTLGGRLVVLFVLAFITAIPVELRIFESEINQRFDNREIELKDNIREKAITQESDFYEGEIKAQEENKADENAHASSSGNTDLEKYQARRATERKAIAERYATDKTSKQRGLAADKEALKQRFAADKEALAKSYKAKEDALNEQIKAIDTKIAEEAGGKYSGIVGIGPIVQSMREEKKNALDEMDKVRTAETEATNNLLKSEAAEMDNLLKSEAAGMDKLAKDESTELTAFDKETTTKVSELQDGRDSKTESVKKERDDKIAALQLALKDKLDAVQAMTGEKLSANYGGEWKVSRGFLDHFRELEELMEEDRSNKAIAWGARLTMMALGLIIFFMKIMVGKGVKEYYSQGTQIAHGRDPDTLELGMALGFTSPESRSFLGLGMKEQRAMMRVLKAQADVSDAIDTWLTEARKWARPARDGAKLCPERASLDGKLEELWIQNVNPTLAELARAERELRVPVPMWAENLPHHDPRGDKEPWRKSDADISRWGWEDPRPLVNQAKEALRRYRMAMHQLAGVLMGFEHRLIDTIKNDPGTDLRELERGRSRFFLSTIFPLLSELEELERTIKAGGLDVPNRLKTIMGIDADSEIWRVNTSKLHELGWIGPDGQAARESTLDDLPLPSRHTENTPADPLKETTDELVLVDKPGEDKEEFSPTEKKFFNNGDSGAAFEDTK